MGLMGFVASCIPGPVEYGMPHANFKIKGAVQSSTTSLYIPDIVVYMGIDSTRTDAQGNFEISQMAFPSDETFAVRLKDVDGSVNGRFIDIDTTITFEDPEFTGGDGDWYFGETEQAILFKMNPLDEAK